MKIKHDVKMILNKYALTQDLIVEALAAANDHFIRIVTGIVVTTEISLPFNLNDNDIVTDHRYEVIENVATVTFTKGDDIVVITVPYMDDYLEIKVNNQYWRLAFNESDITLGQRNELYRITHYLFSLNLTNSQIQSLSEPT